MLTRKTRRVLFYIAIVAGILLLIFLGSLFIPLYGEICEKSEYTGQKDCATYHIALVAFWHVFKFLNEYAAAIGAIATGAIAAFTLTLYLATNEQARLTQQSIGLARDEFISTHRPRLILREAFLGNAFEPAAKLHIHFVIANVGSTDATIIESEKVCSLSDDPLAPMIPRQGNINELGNVTIKPGTTERFELIHPVRTNEEVLESTIRCCLMVRVAYSDQLGKLYEMAFARLLDRKLLRFIMPLPSEVSPELNYD